MSSSFFRAKNSGHSFIVAQQNQSVRAGPDLVLEIVPNAQGLEVILCAI